MDPKSAVVKSKSSNGGVSNKKDKHKTTRSDVEFLPLSMKKRGVYVENKDNRKTLNIYENSDAETKKPPPRPRPGQKKFLTSVLTILSKSTTGTQYPDSDDAKIIKKKNTNKITQRKRDRENETKDQEYITETRTKNKRSKFKSKILNGDNYITLNDRLVTLQSKKEIIHTPSNFSESFTICESANPIKEHLENNIYSGVAEGLAKHILEGRAEKSVPNQEDPATLVADPPKDDKKIYNFFVDLIETTFDIYNVETEQTTNKESDTILEIEETVAKKLNFINDTTFKEESVLNFNIQEENTLKPEYVQEKSLKLSKKKVPKSNSLKAQSFIYPNPKYIPKTSSVVIKRKPQTKKSKKKDLLNTIKEELKTDFMTFEEPQNLYQALRNMAKYKRKCQQKKTIHFESEDNTNINRECLFSRGIFPMKKLRRCKNQGKVKDQIQSNSAMKLGKPKKSPVKMPSNHSLKVYGIEYETDSFDHERKYMSSSNFSDDDYDPKVALGFSDSSIDVKGYYSIVQD